MMNPMDELKPPTRLMLTPGPSCISPRVSRALSAPLVGHVDPWFTEFMGGVQELMRRVFKTQNHITFPISASGTGGIETAVVNVLEPGDVKLLDTSTQAFAGQPNVAAIFLKNGKPYQPGDTLVQTNLANSLSLIAKQGPDAFYKGSIADAIVAASQANGGLLSKADLANYTVGEEQPVTCNYRGYEIVSAPPPSSGGTTLCEILETLNGYSLGSMGFHAAASITIESACQPISFWFHDGPIARASGPRPGSNR